MIFYGAKTGRLPGLVFICYVAKNVVAGKPAVVDNDIPSNVTIEPDTAIDDYHFARGKTIFHFKSTIESSKFLHLVPIVIDFEMGVDWIWSFVC